MRERERERAREELVGFVGGLWDLVVLWVTSWRLGFGVRVLVSLCGRSHCQRPGFQKDWGAGFRAYSSKENGAPLQKLTEKNSTLQAMGCGVRHSQSGSKDTQLPVF